jgi:hypothetical protein
MFLASYAFDRNLRTAFGFPVLLLRTAETGQLNKRSASLYLRPVSKPKLEKKVLEDL